MIKVNLINFVKSFYWFFINWEVFSVTVWQLRNIKIFMKSSVTKNYAMSLKIFLETSIIDQLDSLSIAYIKESN